MWANPRRRGDDRTVSAARPPVRMVTADDLLHPERAAILDGWTVRQGFDLPTTPWDLARRRWVCIGEVTDQQGAEAAIGALARGVGLAIAIALTGDDRRRFEEDLARTGRLVVGEGDPTLGLSTEHTTLLDGLASGLSVTAAASRAYVSRRTANRRLAEVRSRLGVASTAEAVTHWVARSNPKGQPGP